MGAFWRFNGTRLLSVAAIHDRSAARAALVVAADEFHSGWLSTPGAAVGHRLVQILEDDLPGPGLLDLRRRHPAGQVIGPTGDHFSQFGF